MAVVLTVVGQGRIYQRTTKAAIEDREGIKRKEGVPKEK